MTGRERAAWIFQASRFRHVHGATAFLPRLSATTELLVIANTARLNTTTPKEPCNGGLAMRGRARRRSYSRKSLTYYGRAFFVARSMSKMSESSRDRSNTMRPPSVISKVRITAGLFNRVN